MGSSPRTMMFTEEISSSITKPSAKVAVRKLSTVSLSLPHDEIETRRTNTKDPSQPRNWPAWRKIYDTGVSCVLLEYITTLISNTGVCKIFPRLIRAFD
jgi:hypothetical protein